ncbi:M18 family aminopeptidase [Zooshikella harenae]|uniref:M18 family aminopeptidase n=1 Tax=Zooshikella harenae TaxID=2827238 RepID=A0ABS5ZBM5_9GAMM|nr:M18 family aminopeptidase [Zooshikella harenae]MBU2710322.1 M18 family aminopeptidase [Zooshikella harenae]
MSTLSDFNQQLLQFLNASPTPFHAVSSMTELLINAGFIPLKENEDWSLKDFQGYFITRNDSSIIVFTTGNQQYTKHGWRFVGAHTDSPCLKVKPNADLYQQNYWQLGVEVYGGALLNPWYDRDLSLAGRVTFLNNQKQMCSTLINFEEPIAIIPSLAIHLDRNANKERSINPQTDIPPILGLIAEDSTEKPTLNKLLIDQLNSTGHQDIKEILDYELCFYDKQPPALVGLKKEFIASARLDNLLSCFIGLHALVNSDYQSNEVPCLLVCNDHEEVGSQSHCGAQGPFLQQTLTRIIGCPITTAKVMSDSLMISVDNAHGIHPNYADRHDANHGPILNHGPVIKQNCNQRYATNSETAAIYKWLSQQQNAPFQSFIVRTDMACGSTIGPITAGELGVKTLDIGVPTFAMHSPRELTGNQDGYTLNKVLQTFFKTPQLPS